MHELDVPQILALWNDLVQFSIVQSRNWIHTQRQMGFQ